MAIFTTFVWTVFSTLTFLPWAFFPSEHYYCGRFFHLWTFFLWPFFPWTFIPNTTTTPGFTCWSYIYCKSSSNVYSIQYKWIMKSLQRKSNSHITQLSSNINSNAKRKQFILSKQVLEVSFVSCHTGLQLSTPLINRLVNDMPLQTGPCSNQVPLQSSNVEYQRAVKVVVLLQQDPHLVVQIQAWTLHWSQIWQWAAARYVIARQMPKSLLVLQGVVKTHETTCGGAVNMCFATNFLGCVSAKNYHKYTTVS